jgi:hypothetical protein
VINQAFLKLKSIESKARYIELLKKQNFNFNWKIVLSNNKGLLFTDYDNNPQNDRYFRSNRRIGRQPSYRLLNFKFNNREINQICSFFIDNKDKKSLSKLFDYHPHWMNLLTLNNFKKCIKYIFKKEIKFSFNHLKKEYINILVKNKISIIYYKHDVTYLDFNKISFFLKKGGTLSLELLYILFLSINLNRTFFKDLGEIYFYIDKDIRLKILMKLIENHKISKVILYCDTYIKNNNWNKKTIKVQNLKKDIYSLLNKKGSEYNLFMKDYIQYSTKSYYLKEDLLGFLVSKEKILSVVKNKRVKKKLEEFTFINDNKEISLSSWIATYFCKNFYKDVDEQLLLPLIKEYKTNANYLRNYFEFMSHIVSAKKAIKLADSLSLDIRNMKHLFEKIKNHNEGFKVPKFKTLKDLHIILEKESSKVEQKDFRLNQGLDSIDGAKINDRLVIGIPKTSHDLITVGSVLKHCVGNGRYSNHVYEGSIKLVTLSEEDKLLSCIQYSNGHIEQNKGHYNTNIKLSKKDEKKIIKLISDAISSNS